MDLSDARPLASALCFVESFSVRHSERSSFLILDLVSRGLNAGANLVFARKKDGQLRMCVNYAKWNAKTVSTVWPVPNLEQCCEDLSGHL